METAVKLENVTKRFLSTTGSKYSEALTDISFEIAKGSLTILAGANGSGKSVLMNLISGLMKVSEGKIEVSSKPGLVFQEASTQILGDTPREDVAVGLKNLKTPKKEIPSLVEPYANLDYPAVCDVNNLLSQLHSEGKTVILLTHELEKCLALADHFLILQKGKLVYDGTPEDAIKLPLEQWSIRNPLAKYESVKDLIWR